MLCQQKAKPILALRKPSTEKPHKVERKTASSTDFMPKRLLARQHPDGS
jgi:hypothetical protein